MSEVPFLTSHEVADRLHVSVSTVARWAREGHLPAVKTFGTRGRLRFSVVAVEDLERTMNPDTKPVAS